MDDNMLLNLALDAGEIMLAAGAETHRVEDTMERILTMGGENLPEAITFSNVLIVSIHSPLSGCLTMSRKASSRSTDFAKICRVNDLSRRFTSGEIPIEQAYQELYTIYNEPLFSGFWNILSYGVASGAFTLMLKGTLGDSISAFITGILLGLFMTFLSTKQVPYFLRSLFGGAYTAFFAVLFYLSGLGNQYSLIIVGSIMTLLPGVTLTNAIRDVMESNFLSGTSKIMEAFLIATSIAGGVGVVLSCYHGILSLLGGM